MPFFICDAGSCNAPAVRKAGSCLLCGRHLCATHLKPSIHTCPDWKIDEGAWQECNGSSQKQETLNLISCINFEALRVRATSLRGGIPCNITPLRPDSKSIYDLMGGMNYHVPIDFEDGIIWLCRIRRKNANSPPIELQNRVILSEAATLQFLATTKVPVPEVYDFAIESPSNPVGVGYILMEKLNGKALAWYEAGSAAKGKVLEQLADIYIELDKHPFTSIGSFVDPCDQSIGPLLADNFAQADVDGHLGLYGPFTTARDYRISATQHQLSLIRQSEAYSDCSLDAYLVHRCLLDYLPSLVKREQTEGTAFYLKHMDDKGDHILVDDAYNIVGIIDWEWAQTTPKAEAFAAPLFLLDVAAYYDGVNELSDDEKTFACLLEGKGRSDLAMFVRDGRVEHRFAHCLAGEVDDAEFFPNIFNAFRVCLGREDGEKSWMSWRANSLSQYENDEYIRGILGKRP